MLYMFWV